MLILEVISKNKNIILSDISKKTNIPKSTVFRFLNTLEELGYVAKNPSNEHFFTTCKMNMFHNTSSIEGVLIEEGIQIIESIARHTKETVHLAKLEKNKLIYLHKIESTQTLRVSTSSHISGEAPLYWSSRIHQPSISGINATDENPHRTVLAVFPHTALHSKLLETHQIWT